MPVTVDTVYSPIWHEEQILTEPSSVHHYSLISNSDGTVSVVVSEPLNCDHVVSPKGGLIVCNKCRKTLWQQ